MKRIISLVFLLLMLIFIAACSTRAHTPVTESTTGITDLESTVPSSPAEEPSDDASIDASIIITIGAFQKENNAEWDLQSYSRMENAVDRFNAKNGTYKVEIKNYGDASSTDDLYLLNSEIIAGNMPDMLVTYGMPADKYAGSGLLLDLYQWYNRDQFFTGPVQSMEYDGKLFSVSSAIEIYTFYGLTSVLGEADGYSLDDLYQSWEVFNTGDNAFIRQYNGYNAFLILCMMQMESYVDISSATCSFNTPEFTELLEFCHRLPADVIETQTEAYSQGQVSKDQTDALCVKNKDAMLGLLSTVRDTGNIFAIHGSILTPLEGEGIVYVGIPGISPASSGCISEMPIAVSAQSKNLDGARQFLDSLWDISYTELHQNEMRSIPLMRSVLEDYIQYMKDNFSDTYVDENGEEYSAISLSKNILPYTDTYIDDFTALIENASIPLNSLNLSPIIMEEALAYFNDTQTAAKTAENIQARYSIYLEEQN